MSLTDFLKTKWWLAVIGAVLALAIAAAVLVAPRWPFREADLKRRIQNNTNAQVQFGSFKQVFFPHPGCVAENVTLTPNDSDHPTVTIQKLTLDGLYSGLVGSQKHLRMLSLEGLKIVFPAKAPSSSSSGKPDDKPQKAEAPNGIKFDQIEARNSQIVFPPSGKSQDPRTYDIYDLSLKSFAAGEPIRFNAVVRIPEPRSDVKVEGTFGPLTGDEVGNAQLKGRFEMQNADLSTFHAISGILSAQGTFDGQLKALNVSASTDVPKFGVTNTKHALPLRTEFQAVVNGTNGDVQLPSIHAVLGESPLEAKGQIATAPSGHGKLVSLDIASNNARIQDVMYLFVHDKSPLRGASQFKMHVQLPPEKRPFEERIRGAAHFGILHSKFTSAETEQKVSTLSEHAKGDAKNDDPPMVVTDLLGDVKLADGTANFARLNVSVPGASAALHGTYKLQSHAVDLHGTLHTDAKLSQATTGFKSFVLKIIEAAKKKNKKGATVPVKVTGTYEKPDFGLDATAER